jgi:hypothetical protein
VHDRRSLVDDPLCSMTESHTSTMTAIEFRRFPTRIA